MRRIFKEHPIIPLLILTNLVFFVLYRRFLFKGAVFMYSDVGSDSLSSSYPIIAELSRLFETRTFSHYTIWSGLGQDTTATFLQYINPFKLMLLFFGRDNFPIGIMLYLFLQNNLIAIFSYNTFRLLSGNAQAALLPALGWTFSSYIVVWGQNYSYGCCMLMFTIMMYLLELVLRRESLKNWLLLTLWLALFFISNYYFFYMCGVFSAFYVFFHSLLISPDDSGKMKTSARILTMIAREFKLLASAIGALVMSAASLMAIASSFLGSARAGDTGAASLGALFLPYDLHTYGTYLARFFSADLIGAGSAFSGSASYYDAALLSATALTFFAVLFLLIRKKSVLPTVLFCAVSLAMLFFQGTGRILTFNPIHQRYSFIIIFLEMTAVTYFMREILTEDAEKSLRIASILAPILTAGALLVLYLGRSTFRVSVRERTLVVVAGFIVLWAALLFLSASAEKLKKLRYPLMALLLSAELIAVNNTSLNFRDYLTTDSFAHAFFNDGTQNAVASVLTKDTDLYRICASDAYDMTNEGMVDGYMSTTSYSNTTSASAATLARAFSSYELSSNFFRAGYRNYYLYTLLGGRYLITDEPSEKADSFEPALFSLAENSGTQRTFVNNNALPFGYLYENEITGETFASLSSLERMKALTSSYIKTEDIVYTASETSEDNVDAGYFDLVPTINSANNVDIKPTEDGVIITATGPDPFFFFDISEALTGKDSDEVQYLHVSVDRDTVAALGNINFELFNMTEDHPDIGNHPVYELISVNPSAPEMNHLLPDGTIQLRMDLPEGVSIKFEDISLLTDSDVPADFEDLKNTDIRDISFENDTYTATVNAENGGMLCVPLLYSKNWNARVNGDPVPVENINGGFTGIYLAPGTSNVELVYSLPHFGLAVTVSLAACGLWLLLFLYSVIRRK